MKSLLRSAPASIIGYVMVILIVTAGAAQSLSGSNTVFSDDIVDGAVYNPDIHDRAVTGAKVLNDSLTGSDINEQSLSLPQLRKVRVRLFVTSSGASIDGFDGDVTTVTRPAAGVYQIDVPFDLSKCAVTATPGVQGGSGSANPAVLTVGDSGGQVTVNAYSSSSTTGAHVDTSFALTFICN
jgi:hypothetical protein